MDYVDRLRLLRTGQTDAARAAAAQARRAEEAARAAEARCFLPLTTRQGLRAAGWTTIRQSQLDAWRRCPAELGYVLRSRSGDETVSSVSPLNMLLGSVLHAGLADPDPQWSDPSWWMVMFAQVRVAHPGQRYQDQDGGPLTQARVRFFAERFTHPLPGYGGRSVGQLAAALYAHLRENYVVEAYEVTVGFTDGVETAYPIQFEGIVDLLLRTRTGKTLLVDVKSYGFWGPVLSSDGTSPPKAQSALFGEMAYHSQNRHYAWMLERSGRTVHYVGQAYPGNSVPNQTGARKGLPRGAYLAVDPLPDGALADYAGGLRGMLALAAAGVGWPKVFPTYFGKPACLKCVYRATCHATDPSLVTGGSLAEVAVGLYGEE